MKEGEFDQNLYVPDETHEDIDKKLGALDVDAANEDISDEPEVPHYGEIPIKVEKQDAPSPESEPEEVEVRSDNESAPPIIAMIDEKIAEAKKKEEVEDFPKNEGIEVEEISSDEFENVTLETKNKDIGDVVPKEEREFEIDESETSKIEVDTPQEELKESFAPMLNPEEMLVDEFGISKERLDTIEGFSELTTAQQDLVVENLRTVKLGIIQNGAEQQFKEDTANARFLGKMWNGLSKGWKISSLEQTTKENLDKGGMDVYGETFTNLISVAKDGPGVEYINGEPVMQYAPQYENLEPQQMERVKHFNEVANTFTKIPDEWGLESASKREKSQFEAAKKEYARAKEQMVALNLEQTDGNKKAAAEFIFNVDEQVQMGRFLNTHREAESSLIKFLGREKSSSDQVQSELRKIDTPLILRGFTKTIGDKGANALRGYVVRSGLSFAMGMGGLVLAGGLVGGYTGYKQAEKTLHERDKSRREGEEDSSNEAKNFIDASEQVDKLNLLVSRYENADDSVKKQKILHSMEARIKFVEQKMNYGETIYGSGAEKITNQVELLKAKSMAKATHAIESEEISEGKISESRRDELNSRLAAKLEGTKEEIEEVRKEFKKEGMKKGAVIGLGLALAGAAVREYIFDGPEAATSESQAVPPVETPSAAAETVAGASPEVATTIVHTVEKGDNLWNIIKEDLVNDPKYANADEAVRLKMIDEIHDRFKFASPKFLKEIGIESGNADQIEIGEKINLSAVYGNMESEFAPSSDALATYHETIGSDAALQEATTPMTESAVESAVGSEPAVSNADGGMSNDPYRESVDEGDIPEGVDLSEPKSEVVPESEPVSPIVEEATPVEGGVRQDGYQVDKTNSLENTSAPGGAPEQAVVPEKFLEQYNEGTAQFKYSEDFDMITNWSEGDIYDASRKAELIKDNYTHLYSRYGESAQAMAEMQEIQMRIQIIAQEMDIKLNLHDTINFVDDGSGHATLNGTDIPEDIYEEYIHKVDFPNSSGSEIEGHLQETPAQESVTEESASGEHHSTEENLNSAGEPVEKLAEREGIKVTNDFYTSEPATVEQLGNTEYLRTHELNATDYKQLEQMYRKEYGEIEKDLKEIFDSERYEERRLNDLERGERSRFNDNVREGRREISDMRRSNRDKSGLSKVWGDVREESAKRRLGSTRDAFRTMQDEKYGHGFKFEWEEGSKPIKDMPVEYVTDKNFTKLFQSGVNSIERRNRGQLVQYVNDLLKDIPHNPGEGMQNYLYRVAAIQSVGK